MKSLSDRDLRTSHAGSLATDVFCRSRVPNRTDFLDSYCVVSEVISLNVTRSLGTSLTVGRTADPLCLDTHSILAFPSITPMKAQGSAYDVACDSCPVEGNNCTAAYYDRVQYCEPVLKNTGSLSPSGTLETLDLKAGYWRSSNTSWDIRECYEAAACVGGQQGLCASGYEGPCECTKLPVADFKPTLFIFLARYSPRTTRHNGINGANDICAGLAMGGTSNVCCDLSSFVSSTPS